MKTLEFSGARALSAIELGQVGGGDSGLMGAGCNCSGSSAYFGNGGILITTACDGSIYITHVRVNVPVGVA
jgi:hypothetical protein